VGGGGRSDTGASGPGAASAAHTGRGDGGTGGRRGEWGGGVAGIGLCPVRHSQRSAHAHAPACHAGGGALQSRPGHGVPAHSLLPLLRRRNPPRPPACSQDRKMAARVPISAADVARLLESMGVDRVIATDLHCGQIQGFFPPRIPVDNLAAGVVGVRYFASMPDLQNPVIISPDAGGVYRAKQFREGLNNAKPTADAGLAMIIKQRVKAGQIEKMDLVGNVAGSDCIIVDDMIDTAGTLVSAAEDLKKHGARKVYAFATHGLFSGPAADRIARSVLEAVIVTDTIPLSAASKTTSKITQLPVAPLMAEAIKRVHLRQSVSDLFASGAKGAAAKAAPAPAPAAAVAPAKAAPAKGH
jgi:ribose-phosphate pyrophosphokinase